ncbi:MAG: translation initiation factor IF-2 N-terminal domain-containing protein, partial [Actinomycetota bacterium]|nr:translation initiation factor IF-2 N-terminal domain-containing protein [Actinomycetota bacterium]
MAGKARVHELAKELGVTSKQVLSKLQDMGEYVKSPSSTVEAPVARKLRESMASASNGAGKPTTRGRRPSPAGVASVPVADSALAVASPAPAPVAESAAQAAPPVQ